MSTIPLDLFVRPDLDAEHARYQVLGALQRVRRAFARTIIYPHLAELVRLHSTLRAVVERSEGLRNARPGAIKGIDLESKSVVYEQPDLSRDQMAHVEDRIRWALPHIEAAIEEGRTIFEFVEEHLHLEEVGVVPSYVQEGYLIVPDAEAKALHILQYQMTLFTNAEERFRSLKTIHVKTVPQPLIRRSPQSVKLELVEERRELPNPATYAFDTDLEFPYAATVLPVAKRKLMRYLYGQA